MMREKRTHEAWACGAAKGGQKYKYVYLGSEDNMHRIRNDDAVDIVEKWDEEKA
jgi:hypothetical protein